MMFGWLRSKSSKSSRTSPMTPSDAKAMVETVTVVFASFSESNPIGFEIVDESLLPYPKDLTLNALCVSAALEQDEAKRAALHALALSLAHYQPGIGIKPLTAGGIPPDIIKLGNKLNPELIVSSSDPKLAARFEKIKNNINAEYLRIGEMLDYSKKAVNVRR